MKILEFLSGLLGTLLTPAVLLASALLLLPQLPLRRLIHPKIFARTICDFPENARTTPFSALSMALAGTLGVGNITGVASALISGGAGAVFWMWAGAAVSVVVKYAEVYLAVKFRREDRSGRHGGAMYYIRDGLSSVRRIPYRVTAALGSAFAVLCCLNSLITGNIVQANAAVCVMPEEHRLMCGILLGVLVFASLLYGSRRIERITSALMPPLTAVYFLLALTVLVRNAALLPEVIGDIFRSAFAPRAVFGGTVGFTVREGIRYGVMRGIFSNEAGCGTSPTAHASADTKSPHHQACFGIVEVVFDTLVLCTLTALVLLTADRQYGIIPWKTSADAAAVTLDAFRAVSGDFAAGILSVSVVLFAYATIIAQIYYGTAAIRYLTKKKLPLLLYFCASAGCTVIGAVIASPLMWTLADVILGLMTVMNCIVLLLLRQGFRD